nr:transposase, MuDR, MULE transposase domain protein [Tanacetum cinerariifolium]
MAQQDFALWSSTNQAGPSQNPDVGGVNPDEMRRANMNIMQVVQPDAYQKLCQARTQRWSRAHCPLVRYNYMTSNSVKSVNAYSVINRKLPVLELAETYRTMLQDWYFECQKLTGNMKYEITDWVVDKVHKRKLKSATWIVHGVNQYVYQVSDGRYNRQVNLETDVCECRKWVSKLWKFIIDSSIFIRDYGSRQCETCCFNLAYKHSTEEMDFKDMVSYLTRKIPKRFTTLYYTLPSNHTLSGLKAIKNDDDTNVMYDISKVAGKLQIYAARHPIDLSTVLIPNDGSLEKSFAELQAEVTLANKLSRELTRVAEQMRIREIHMAMLHAMPLTSLNSYGLHAVLMTHESDIRITHNLRTTRDELLRSIAEKQKFIDNYRAI